MSDLTYMQRAAPDRRHGAGASATQDLVDRRRTWPRRLKPCRLRTSSRHARLWTLHSRSCRHPP